MLDHGVYRLHAMTGLLGPARRVQAMGAIASPTRLVRGGPLTGRTIDVTTAGAVGTLAPWLEVHCTGATISFGGQSHEKDPPISLYVDDDSPAATEGWHHAIDVPAEPYAVVETGVHHFIDCLRGKAEPILTAEHARHVLDITLKAYASITDGASHATETTF